MRYFSSVYRSVTNHTHHIDVTCIQLCLYESATLDSIALETVEGDPEIVFEIDDSALDDLKVVLDSRKIVSESNKL